MKLANWSEPIIIDKSTRDSRDLIMPHQKSAVDEMTKYFKLDMDIHDRNGLVVMPTGSGKTYTAVNWLLSEGVAKGYRIVWLVHRQELVEQTYQEFRKQTPLLKGSDVKKIKIFPISGVHMKMSMASRADVYVCSIASVANKYGYRFIERMIGAQGKRRLIIVVDEAHHAVASNYQKIIKRMTTLNPNRILLGLTATPTRMQDSQKLRLLRMFNADKNIKNNIGVKRKGYVYEVTLKQLLASGFLANPKYIPVSTDIVGEIEYECTKEDELFFEQFGDLSERIKNRIGKSSARNKKIVDQYLKHQEKYGKTIVFAYDQNHAETLCETFRNAGVSCDYAVSNRADAQEVIHRFKNNEFKVLINVQIMTEGSDVPDIQTVFLARETNSDSLLMQMIGRGLRGEKAGGTKDAYIVAFHDTWEKFVGWIDPGALDIFDKGIEQEEDTLIEEEDLNIEISPNEEMLALLERLALANDTGNSDGDSSEIEGMAPQEDFITQRDLYMKLYNVIKVNLVSEEKRRVCPCGWYSVINEEGEDEKLLVFDVQLNSYEDIQRNIKNITPDMSVDALQELYFGTCDVKPELFELQLLLDYIIDTGEMPLYFELSQREAFDLKEIGEAYQKIAATKEDEDSWLKELFEKAPILQQIYHYFYAFKKSVLDAIKESVDAEIVTVDEREKYQIVENYYNLSELLDEIKEQYPKLRTDGLVKIAWSNSVVRDWYALCERYIDNGKVLYQLHVNKLLSSPKIEKELIKYLIFHELLHQNGYWEHDMEFRIREWSYPDSDKWDGILDSLGLEYDLDIHFKDSVKNEVHLLNVNEQVSAEDIEEEKDNNPYFNSSASGVQEGIKYCRNCGNRLPKSAKFCDKCGTMMDY